MKNKMQNALQVFARAIIQPVMFIAVTGLVISIAAILKLEQMPSLLKGTGDFFFTIMSSGVIGNLGIIFCVGIATAMADKNKKVEAAIIAVTNFFVFLYANNFWLIQTNQLAEDGAVGLYGTGQNLILGVQVTDMGVFLGIILGLFTGYAVNKLGNVKFHKYLSAYEGTKFSYLVLIFGVAFFAILTTYIWPIVNNFINSGVKGMAGMGAIGFFLYGFFNRLLLPFGLHHLLWMPLYYTPLGGTAEIAGATYSGAVNIWLAQLGNIGAIDTIDKSIGYLVNFGYIALPIGIVLAFIATAQKQKRAEITGYLIPILLASIIAGITEPIEFLFLFISPLLWFVHSIVYGFGLLISNVLGLHMAVGNLIETIIYAIATPMHLGHQWLLLPIGLGLVAIEYFIFKFIIVKLNLPTIGRVLDSTDMEFASSSKKEAKQLIKDCDTTVKTSKEKANLENLALIVEGLGGKDNIRAVNNCYTRLRFDVKDKSKVNLKTLQKYPSSGVINKDSHIQIIIGFGVKDVRDELEAYIDSLPRC